MSDLVWHITQSSINIFYKGDSLVISSDHRLYPVLKEMLALNQGQRYVESQTESESFIIEIINEYKKEIDIERVSRLLGLKSSDF